MFEENSTSMALQLVIIFQAIIIIILLYFERSTTSTISQKVNDFKPPECPKCPDCPPCNCNEEGCPDCVCPENKECPKCPDVKTSCPTQKSLTVDDIVDAIFPGRHRGLTSHGKYFPLDGLGEAQVEPAYSPVTNLMPNYVGGDGVPAAISFADQKLLSKGSSIGLASQKEPPIVSTQGVFSDKKKKAAATPAAAGTAATPAAAA